MVRSSSDLKRTETRHGVVGGDLRRGRRARGLAARARLARGARRFRRPGTLHHDVLPGQRRGQTAVGGARSALERLGVADAAARAPAYAAAKQALVDRLIAEGSFEAFPDAVRLPPRAARGRAAPGARLLLEEHRAMLRRLALADGRPLPAVFDADLSGRDVRAASRTPRSSCWPPRPGDPAGAVPGGRGRAGRRRGRAPPA